MPSFFVRVGFACAFVQEKNESGTDVIYLLRDNLDKKYSPELMLYRYTFAMFTMQADKKTDCEAEVKRTWASLFPDDPGAVHILVYENDGSDTSSLIYTILTVYYGVQEYQELITDLTVSIPLLKERGAMKAFRMQNYLFAIDPGCGFTTLLSSFGNYLQRMQVYDENIEKRANYIEYKVCKESEGEKIGMGDVIDDLNVKNEDLTLNMVGLDISWFLEGEKLDELRNFVRRLYFLQNKYVFVFRVPYLEKKSLDRIAETLSDLMILRTVRIPPLHDYVLLEYMWDSVQSLGYSTSSALSEPFFEKIRAEKKDGRFYGFKTAEKIVQQMILEKAKNDADREANGETVNRKQITPADLKKEKNDKKEKTGYEELKELIGMETIAERVSEIVAQVKMSINDEKLDRPCIHMRFVGAPGTGKTTVARIIGRIFREEGILRKGAFLEYSARSLCAEYVGQTAVKTAAICRDAYGSVLFIDEAYALYDDSHQTNDYGKEALTTLISEMENHRDDMLVIMAGYTDDMEMLMKGNAGLRSRMPYILTFKSYTKEQLFEIFMLMVRKHFDFTEALEAEAKRFFDGLPDEFIASREFANARYVRNLYERTWSKGALRTALSGGTTVRLEREDFIAASSEDEFSEKLERRARVGFSG